MLEITRGEHDVTEGDQLTLEVLINLATDPQEREPASLPHLHPWAATHFNRILHDFEASLHREPPIPMGAPLDHIPAPPGEGWAIWRLRLACTSGRRG